MFGFDADDRGVFARTLEACESLCIDGVTASVLTPLPGTSLHVQMKQEGRLLEGDWASFDCETRVAFRAEADDRRGTSGRLPVVSQAVLFLAIHRQAPAGLEG
jgi:hypothetical protein